MEKIYYKTLSVLKNSLYLYECDTFFKEFSERCLSIIRDSNKSNNNCKNLSYYTTTV